MTPLWAQRLSWVMWPSFLMAAIGELAFFALIDPSDVMMLGQPLQADRMTVYTLGFFALWAFAAASSALTLLLAAPPAEINRGRARPAAAAEPGQVP